MGRPAGSKNKNQDSADVRATIRELAERNVLRLEKWILDIPDPKARVEMFLRAIEYHIPKLSRAEVTGKDGAPLVVRSAPLDDQI